MYPVNYQELETLIHYVCVCIYISMHKYIYISPTINFIRLFWNHNVANNSYTSDEMTFLLNVPFH